MHCAQCDNDANHSLYWVILGRYMAFAGQPFLGKKRYFYVCPICKAMAKEITEGQAKLLKVGG